MCKDQASLDCICTAVAGTSKPGRVVNARDKTIRKFVEEFNEKHFNGKTKLAMVEQGEAQQWDLNDALLLSDFLFR